MSKIVLVGPDGKPDTTDEKIELILNLKSANLSLGVQCLNLWTALTALVEKEHGGQFTWTTDEIQAHQSADKWGSFEQDGASVTFTVPSQAEIKKRKKEMKSAN